MLAADEIKETANQINKDLNLLQEFYSNNGKIFETAQNVTVTAHNKTYAIAAVLGTISGLTIILLEYLLIR